MDFEQLQRLGLALAIGLLVGMERGWKERDQRDGSRTAGIRTYGLIGILGGISALLAQFAGNAVLAVSALVFMLVFGAFEWRENKEMNTVSATGFVAGTLVFLLGAYAIFGDKLIAASAGVVITIILTEREVLHGFLKRMTLLELRAALLLLGMTVVLLPVLPNRTVDPWGALNPFQLWSMMVLIAVISYAGYIAVRVLGPRNGLLFVGAAGGLISSTTVTLTLSGLAKKQVNAFNELRSGIAIAWIVSFLRMAIIAVAVSPALFWLVWPPAAISVFLTAILALQFLKTKSSDGNVEALRFDDPVEIWSLLRFGLLLMAIMLASKLFSGNFQNTALLGLTVVSGVVDVDPITLSLAKMAGSTISQQYALSLILVAGGVNLISKCAVAAIFGGIRFATPLLIIAASVFCAIGLWQYAI